MYKHAAARTAILRVRIMTLGHSLKKPTGTKLNSAANAARLAVISVLANVSGIEGADLLKAEIRIIIFDCFKNQAVIMRA